VQVRYRSAPVAGLLTPLSRSPRPMRPQAAAACQLQSRQEQFLDHPGPGGGLLDGARAAGRWLIHPGTCHGGPLSQ